MHWELEEIARVALERANAGTPVHPETVARELKLRVLDGPDDCEGLLVGRRIFVARALRAERRQFAIAHEIGHHLQREHGLERSERGADYLASALLLPRLDFEADLRRFDWDLIRLHARHRHASFEALARRIAAMREARVVVFDWPLNGQRRDGWYTVPWNHWPTDEEKLAAGEARECGAPVEIRAGLTAWPVLQHDWHRVITIAAT